MSARDLIDIYRVKELTKETEIYGIIGNPVSHSLSPYIHNPAFKEMGIDAVYIPFEVSNLDEFVKRMVRPETREIDWNLQGFSVTAPHKESILKHLDFIDNAAEKIGAVNTVKIVDNRLCGFNTDAEGFIEPLRKNFGDLKNARAGIIGNGGAARACLYALKNDGAEVTIIARDTERGNALANEFEAGFFKLDQNENAFPEFDILINASPLGTYGKLEDQTPIAADRLSNLQLAYDLVYNPFETRFLREAKSKGVKTIGGFEMLIAQAARQFEIWTGSKAPADKFAETALLRLKESK
ncbi:MAG: shikimate dehydrogenase [Pyrinomonadaceae bacterium]